MDDQKTTTDTSETGDTVQGVAVDDQAQAVSQPDKEESTSAAKEDVTEAQETTEPQEEEKSSEDDNSKWLESKGIDPTSPDAISKLTKSAREAEKAMHQKAGEASQLKKSMETVADTVAEEEATATGQDPETAKLLKRLIVRDSLRDFWEANPDAKKHEQELAKIVTERPYLAGDLEAAYALVQTNTLKSEGKKEALKSLASKQQAAVPAGSAVSGSSMGTSKITPENVNELVGKNDLKWFEAHQDEINQAMAG